MCGRRWEEDVPLTPVRERELREALALLQPEIDRLVPRDVSKAALGRFWGTIASLLKDYQENPRLSHSSRREQQITCHGLLCQEIGRLSGELSWIARTRLELKWLEDTDVWKPVRALWVLLQEFRRQEEERRCKEEFEHLSQLLEGKGFGTNASRFREWL